jgi:BirA family biotin operon repressor/biotin-[acetyl-CoA-carboxylase] ligase
MSSRDRVMAALREADGFVSGQKLAATLDISRAAVWKHVTALKNAGHEIESVRSRGYRLIEESPALSAGSFSLPHDAMIGNRVIIKERTSSTNSDAMLLGQEGADEGLVVIAEEQTAGRGRLGRSWESRHGLNLYLSILLRPQIAPAAAPGLALVAGVSVAEALEETGVSCAIKWPNDVVTAQMRKVCGILAEIQAEADRVSFVVLGIGVNLNAAETDFPQELQDRASSVFIETGRRVDRAAFARSLFQHFERSYLEFCRGGLEAIAGEWQQRSILHGKQVVAAGPRGSISGTCVGLDEDGALLLDTPEGRQRVVAGDVTIEGGYEQ